MSLNRAPKLTEEQKACIERGQLGGVSNRNIAIVLGINEARIRTYISRNRINFGLEPAPIIKEWGKYRSQRMAILSIISTYPEISVAGIIGKLKTDFEPMEWYPSETWIRNYLKERGKDKLTLQLKPPINARIKGLRLDFARKWLNNGAETLGNIIWTDETMIRSHPSKKRRKQWMNKGTPMLERPVQIKKPMDGISVMFWGCFSKHGFGPIVNVEGSMNATQYIEFIRDYLLPELEVAKQLFEGDWRIMQDNAPCHRAKRVKDFLMQNGVEFIDWPPYSPDLNPIENIWAWMKRKLLVDYGTPETEEELIANVREIWTNIPPEMADRYCGSYERRLQAVIEADGGYTKY